MNDEARIFLARSRIRLAVLKELTKKPQIASFLAKDLKKHRESISRIFLDLEESGYVVCSNPKDAQFRYYELTNKGKELVKELAKEKVF